MSEDDWKFWEWALENVKSGSWGDPWCVGYEVGGVGVLWEAIAREADFERQIPRLYNSIHCGENSPDSIKEAEKD